MVGVGDAENGHAFLKVCECSVAVDNALAFQEIAALKDQLSQEKAYLEEEVRTEHNFGEIVGQSIALLFMPLALGASVWPAFRAATIDLNRALKESGRWNEGSGKK